METQDLFCDVDYSKVTCLALEVSKRCMETARRGSRVVFLVPTTPMVRWCYRTVTAYQTFSCCHVIRNAEVVSWEFLQWDEHIRHKDLLITTPQLFHDVLASGHLHLSMFEVLVIFECQHCSGRHPYARIFAEHYRKQLRVLGISRSLLKGDVKSATEKQSAIRRE